LEEQPIIIPVPITRANAHATIDAQRKTERALLIFLLYPRRLEFENVYAGEESNSMAEAGHAPICRRLWRTI
jgi:hypothetical protein